LLPSARVAVDPRFPPPSAIPRAAAGGAVPAVAAAGGAGAVAAAGSLHCRRRCCQRRSLRVAGAMGARSSARPGDLRFPPPAVVCARACRGLWLEGLAPYLRREPEMPLEPGSSSQRRQELSQVPCRAGTKSDHERVKERNKKCMIKRNLPFGRRPAFGSIGVAWAGGADLLPLHPGRDFPHNDAFFPSALALCRRRRGARLARFRVGCLNARVS